MNQHPTAGYLITTDRSLMNVADIHHWLSTNSYWSPGIPIELVQTAFDNSFVAGVIKDGMQIGYARLVTDYAIFAYLADVYIEEGHRGRGLSKAMIKCLMDQPWVAGLRRLMLATKDAHGLYEQYGFTSLQKPDRLMEISRPIIYQAK
jgi:N-acetylglutamate synthase-like GNAT family acetyltransferase